MSILIKGIDMPKPGQIVLFEINENGDVFAAYDGGRTKLAQYKAIHVPPHGDLIDRDAYQYSGDLMYEPVIIPAEEEE